MKNIMILIILAISIASIFSACEPNKYQHPLHRSK